VKPSIISNANCAVDIPIIFDFGVVLEQEEPCPSGMPPDAITPIEVNRGSGGPLRKRPQRHASADRTRNPTKGSRVAKSEIPLLGDKGWNRICQTARSVKRAWCRLQDRSIEFSAMSAHLSARRAVL
jgi:hypothetical protein